MSVACSNVVSGRTIPSWQVVPMEAIPDDVPVDGSTEWKAVPWRLPRHHSSPAQLACLLFCKGVAKAEVSACTA